MRLTKGTEVEVFSRREVLSGAWTRAEIISGNGHTYRVKYDCFPMADEAQVVDERVPRKLIRPRLPPVQGMVDWAPGDLVELFDNPSWKTATIVKVIGNDNFLVRIVGLSKCLLVHKSYLRIRQCWKDGRWFVVRMGEGNLGERQLGTKIKQFVGDDYFCEETDMQKSQVVSTRTSKRKSTLDTRDSEVCLIDSQKRRLVENNGIDQWICSVRPSAKYKKVDSVNPNVFLGEKIVQSSFNDTTAEFSRMDAGCGSDSFVLDSTTSYEGCSSSVGSCSTLGNDAYNLPLRFCHQHSDNMVDYCSDAESSTGVDYEKDGSAVPLNDKYGVEFHRPELLSYYSIVVDLYASGPLSWDDEAKLANLRDMLHISDEEHLKHMDLNAKSSCCFVSCFMVYLGGLLTLFVEASR